MSKTKVLIFLFILLFVVWILLVSANSKTDFAKSLVQKVRSKTKPGVYQINENEAQAFADVATKNGFKPEWLANLVNFETAGTFSPAIQNPTSRATGLIQFMPATARGLGTSVEALRAMNFLQQLKYVDLYLQKGVKVARGRVGGKPLTQIDLFMIVFYPVSVGKPNYVFPQNVINANNGISTPQQYTDRALRNRLF